MISGGGTGGHIYPAISIAQSLQQMLEEVEILFVGAKGKMEMKKVPEAGFPIVGLWISGLQRKLTFKNLLFPLKVIVSLIKSRSLLKKFKPDAVIGVGGYASGPLLFVASSKGVSTIIQEQNSYAGLTNKWLAKRVDKICVAYPEMERYFPKEKLVLTGNPIRNNLVLDPAKKAEAFGFFGLDPKKKTLLVIGGSLGARTINESIMAGLSKLVEQDIQVIWQTGEYYFEKIKAELPEQKIVKVMPFLKEMHYGYAVADLVVSRAGALSIAELMLTGKPSILVPSPNVAEDHQTKNAMALVKNEAAELVKDIESKEKLVDVAIGLMADDRKRNILSERIHQMAIKDASERIAKEIMTLIQ
ncbi:MAG: undecaprenyldiphospho-muramoylpentapeptide beta-N-acetylglucosaminyltransferase [Bacteroidota bacterium]